MVKKEGAMQINWSITLPQVQIDVIFKNDKFLVVWSDHVANDWMEEFATLSEATMHVAKILECIEKGDY